MVADVLLTHFNQIVCPNDPGHPLTGQEMKEATIIEDGYLALKDGLIMALGSGQPDASLIGPETVVRSYEGKIATPGIIDCHTHLVYGGSREHEFAQKLAGVPYLDILAQGGGILSTVRATRAASFDNLYQKSKRLLDYMLLHGVTTVEAKSGYGLDWETEKRQLDVVAALEKDHPIDLVSTFMAAHAIPEEYKGNAKAYLDEIVEQMLPEVKKENLAEFCDIFCEKNVFTAEESRYLLSKAKELGFKLRIHADEIASIGGVDVAAELGAISAEHLMMATDEGIAKMSQAGVIGNLLPATTFSLMEDTYAPARKMIDAGMAITLSTDSNPGSCPTANMQFVMQLGCFMLRLTPIEVLNAVTINAAYSVNRQERVGSLTVGKEADIAIFDAPNIDYPLYFFATNLIHQVYKKGQLVVDQGRIL
ncbi:imidazolonepropionase [Streptococcus dysgalactiae subsp. equisimilis]|uniref:Imidazolonepropionase n=1 Tax=Streptococcus dysgalactiae subsp. equisimilis TaxID=119602 RepID=A0AAE9U132_STREQ|nr:MULTISPECIES: imidazolonepropionase [Streptococcus]EGR87962.1 imidazolonepropionase [Streptococcus dysgalactiae subsp. equisimilis SK1250]BAN94527.1 imidazolonepropionase [Streptococcus dysgalactiae subsp. equisimilis 167]HEP1542618.1 imidazolonepropionase [Streptococcus pyogenes]KKC16679.1 imidazolonepropionase [Streptococcus dysgalactiae subsp. equisimilis]KKC19452.1 imidazolonepropionase [Streptococcus dysgalactiae subsp. equisimilis]